MSFDPERWLQVADVCCINIPQIDPEALLRTAVNRAYYAALLSLKRRLEGAFGAGAIPTSGTHHAVLQTLRTGDRFFRLLHDELRSLRDLRNRVDYELTTAPLVRSDVVKYVGRSRTLIRNRINAMHDDEYRRLRIQVGDDR